MITITAPKKGLGQTVTSINIAVKIGNLLEEKVLLIDINQYCCGVVDYLSNTTWTRGLDEFKINMDSGWGLSGIDHHKWCKAVTTRLNIMASNQYVQLNKGDIDNLEQHIKDTYPVTLVDTIAGQNNLTELFLQQSKLTVVILTQDLKLIRLIREKRLYANDKDKVIFVVNQFRQGSDGIKIKFGLKEMKEELKGLGFDENSIYTLPYDSVLLNECNDSTLLNYSLSKENQSTLYHQQLDKLARRILKDYGNFPLSKEDEAVRGRKTIFNFFNL